MASNPQHKPRYTVKDVCNLTGLSPHTIRYYDDSGLLPEIARTAGNVRLFSDYDLNWLQVVHCFRVTGMSIKEVKTYIDLCGKGDSTLEDRWQMILRQEEKLREQLSDLKTQMKILQNKKTYYAECRKERELKQEKDAESSSEPIEFSKSKNNFKNCN